MIFIPSKGRSGNCKTANLLTKNEMLFEIVVEPQEEDDYRMSNPDASILVLPDSNRGIGFVRQWILDYARKNYSSYWMLDDDITGFYKVEDKKCKRFSPELVLAQAQDLFESTPTIAQGALEYQQYAWSAKHKLKFNSYCDVAVWITPQKIPHLNYRTRMDLKEDRDFTLQILASGLNSARSCLTAFSAPKNGSNEGGLFKEYAMKGRELEAVARMCEAWPGICVPQVKPDGRNDLKINWSHFKFK